MSLAAAMTVFNIIGGMKKSSALKKGGKLSHDAFDANADDVEKVAEINKRAILGAAANNAKAYRTVGEANALAVERATVANLTHIKMQGEEDIRLHRKAERELAGEIRARAASTGFVAELGSPQYFRNAQVEEGYRRRDYQIKKIVLTALTTAQAGKDRRDIFRLEADQKAKVIISNAALQAEVAMADAAARAASMRRQGDIALATGNAQASAAMWSSISSGISSGVNMHLRMGGTFPSWTGFKPQ